MSDYAIGDVQGCFDALMRLLDHIQFNDRSDRLWFVGDLVNRGPKSLEVLRFIKNLPIKACITLGNHDLHLLARIFNCTSWTNPDDTLDEVLAAEDSKELGHWLRQQPLLHYDAGLNIVMSHAGIAPVWNLAEAKLHAKEVEQVLMQENFCEFLAVMYGNQPDFWDDRLHGFDRLRIIVNYFTRMRLCDSSGRLFLSLKGTLAQAPANLIPWYEVPARKLIEADIVFGHWAALGGKCSAIRVHAIDTGCFWGNPLTALRLQDKKRFLIN